MADPRRKTGAPEIPEPGMVHEGDIVTPETGPGDPANGSSFLAPVVQTPSFFDAEEVGAALRDDNELQWTIRDHIRTYHELLNDETLSPKDRLKALSQYETFRSKLESERIVRTMIRQTDTIDAKGSTRHKTEREVSMEIRNAIDMTPASEVFEKERQRELKSHHEEEEDGEEGRPGAEDVRIPQTPSG